MKIAANIKIYLFLPNCFGINNLSNVFPCFSEWVWNRIKTYCLLFSVFSILHIDVCVCVWLTGDSHHSLVFLPQAAQAWSPWCVRWTLWVTRPPQGLKSKSGGLVNWQWKVTKAVMTLLIFEAKPLSNFPDFQKGSFG